MNRYFLSAIIITLLSANIVKAADDPDTLYRQGNFARAQKAYTEADMNHPKDIRYRYNRGCAAYQNSDYKAADAAFSSVLKRTDDKELRYKALYNLGNTAFKQKDFESAASYYKQAIICNPNSEDAGYNLELSLLELDKQKKKDKDRKNESQQDSQKKEDKPGKSGENKKDDNKNRKASDKQSQDNKENKNNKSESEKPNQAGSDKKKEQNTGKNDEHQGSKDLSGEPDPLQQMPQQKENMAPETKSMPDKKKAEALLGSVREDRSKLMDFNSSDNSKEGVRSGKDW